MRDELVGKVSSPFACRSQQAQQLQLSTGLAESGSNLLGGCLGVLRLFVILRPERIQQFTSSGKARQFLSYMHVCRKTAASKVARLAPQSDNQVARTI